MGFEAETPQTYFMQRSGRAVGRDGSSEAEEVLGGCAALPVGATTLKAEARVISPGSCPGPALAPGVALHVGCSSLLKSVLGRGMPKTWFWQSGLPCYPKLVETQLW